MVPSDLTLDIPEAANVETIVSESALMLSKSKRLVASAGVLGLSSISQMLHRTAFFLIIFLEEELAKCKCIFLQLMIVIYLFLGIIMTGIIL